MSEGAGQAEENNVQGAASDGDSFERGEGLFELDFDEAVERFHCCGEGAVLDGIFERNLHDVCF